MSFPAFAWRTLACGWLLLASTAVAKDKPVPGDHPGSAPPLLLHEIWVPTTALDLILARYPRTVSLGRDELLTLLHDAHAVDPAIVDPATAPPERAVLRQARFDGRLVAGAGDVQQVRVSAELEVEAFADEWAEVPLDLRGLTLGSAEIDDSQPASLRRLAAGRVALLTRGRGVHHLRLGFMLPVETLPTSTAITLPTLDGIGEFALHLPGGTRAECLRGCDVQPEATGVVARVALGAADAAVLTWRTAPPLSDAPTAILQSGQLGVWVEASAVTIRQKVVLKAALGPLPTVVQVPLPPEARAVQVEGAPDWDISTDGLHVTLDPTNQEDWGGVWFGVTYELPLVLDPSGAVAKISVPLLEVVGAHRVVSNRAEVRTKPGVQVRRIDPGAVATPTNEADAVASFSLEDLPVSGNVTPPVALTLEARRAAARFSVDADVHADFQPDGVHVQRTLAFHVEEGEVFTTRIILPKEESFLDLRAADGSPPPAWRQEGASLVLTWNGGLRDGSKTVVVVESRAELVPPKAGSPVDTVLGAALVPGVERLTGYVALSSAPALRIVTTGGDERLERRDGRTTPVVGDVAWFYRDDFRLALRVERRSTETEARFTGYALPLAGAVEIHGQIDYHFLHAGVDTVRIRVPAETAEAFFFTGAHIAERRREGDGWTIRFQGEQTGDYALGVQATIPAPANPDDAERFHFRLPGVVPLDTARWSGVWAVEANTDTEISFHAVGASEVDTLHAPTLAGYQPTRRVIGVFEFLGGGTPEAAVDLDGVRHPAADVAAAVVDSLTLETFASTSGVSRHRATLRARTAGDGFFNIHLPDGAALWSLTRDGALVKPIGGTANELRVELPGGREPAAASTVVMVYETPGQPWTNSGRRSLAAPGFDPGVPVVESHWTLHLPDGFDYRIDDGALAKNPVPPPLGDLLILQIGSALGHAVQWACSSPGYLQGLAPVVTELDSGPVAAPAFIDRVQQVKQLFIEARNDYEAGRYDFASKHYGQILAIDPYNDAARKGQERVDLARARTGITSAQHNSGALRDEQALEPITRKLQNIIIPNIEFRSTTVGDAIEFLRQESRRLDPDPDPEARGVNIFLKLPGPGASVPPVAPNTDPVIPGLPPLLDPATSGPAAPPASTRITLTMSRLPLLEALKYVAQQAGLKVKVEQYAVSIVPLSELTDTLVTQEYKVPPGFFGSAPAAMGGGAVSQGATTATGGALNTQHQDAKAFLEASGVTFPPGASATYLPGTGKLVVRNTQENTDLIESLAQEVGAPAAPPPSDDLVTLDGQRLTPAQIKAAETHSPLFGNDAMPTAAFPVTPNFFANLPVGTGSQDVTGVGTVTIQRQDAKSFLEAQGIKFPPGASATYLPSTGKIVVRNTPDAIKQLAGLVAPGSAGKNANAIDALLYNGSARKPGIFSMAGVFADQQFQSFDGRKTEARVAGLLPIRLDLPSNGLAYEFAGGGAPGTLDFRYTDWRSAARWRWVCLTLGAGAFLCFAAGWAHPWRRTFWAALALTFWPLVVAPGSLTVCNALLAGWLWAVLGWGVTRFLLRRRRFVVTVTILAAATLWPTFAPAAPRPGPTPGPSPETVIVPYDVTRPAAGQQPTSYYLPYERFLGLWDAAKRHRRPAAPAPPPGGERYALNTARYDARPVGDTLVIDADIDFQTFGEGWVPVKFKFDGTAIGALTLDGAPASFSPDGDLWIGTPGAHHLAATLTLPNGKLTAGSDARWSVPPTVATLVTVLLPRPDLRVEIHSDAPGSGSMEETVPEGRRYLAAAGGATRLALHFHDAPPPAPAAGQPTLARIDARLVARTRQETVHSEIRFSFAGGTQSHFTVFLDPNLTLTDLDAPDVQAWHLVTTGDRQTLDLTLDRPARDTYRLAFEADRPLSAETASRRTFPKISAQAGRIEQTAALLTEGALEIILPDGPPAGARRTESPAAPGEGRKFGAFASDGSAVLVYSVNSRTVKRAAHIDYLYQLGRGRIESAAAVRFRPEPGGSPIQTATLRLPPGVAVQAVVGGSVRQWWRDGDDLSLRFRPDAPGEVSLLVYLVQPIEGTASRVPLRPLTAVGFAETEGQAVVTADRSLKVGLEWPRGTRAHDLAEMDPGTAATEFQVKAPLERQRAFRYRGAEFEVGATLDLLPALWQAQAVTRATVREGTVALEARINVEARQGALDALEFTLPAGLPDPGVSGPLVRETIPMPMAAGQDRHTYRVLFQNPVYGGGEAALTVTLEAPLNSAGRATLPDFRFPGSRAASEFLLVENASSGEMALDPRGLDPATEKDVPFLPAQIVAGTRFFRVAPGTPWSLGIAVTGLEKTAGRAALVAYAELTSTLRDSGEEWHRATYRLQNRRLQFLPVELPAGAEFIGARVAGESVRVDAGPAASRGQPPSLLIPLLKTRPGELSYDVELVYRRPAPGLGNRHAAWAHWQLEDPRLPGIPVEKTLWNVYLPADARLVSSSGNLEPVVAALNETEKLESDLSDLRSLSATYQSAGATRQEQQLALSNFNSLAATVQRGAEAKTSRRLLGLGALALFKGPNAVGQDATINQKQNSIRRELDSLNAANVAVQQNSPPASPGGRFDYGGKIRSTDASPEASSDKLPPPDWRDNRANTPSPKALPTSNFVSTHGRELALNDSITVNLSTTPDLPEPEVGRDLEAATGSGAENERLSTARTKSVAMPAAPAISRTLETLARKTLLAPAAPVADASSLDPGTTVRIESLRSVGRISLAVDFPQEGQMYHFKKLQADARLTLWSVHPASFARLGWLAWLVVLLAAGWLGRWLRQKRIYREDASAKSSSFVSGAMSSPTNVSAAAPLR